MKLFGLLVLALLMVGNLCAIPPQAPKPPQAPPVKEGCYCHGGGDCLCVYGCACPQCSCLVCPGKELVKWKWRSHNSNWNYHAATGWYYHKSTGYHYHPTLGYRPPPQQYQQPVQMTSFVGFAGGYGAACSSGG